MIKSPIILIILLLFSACGASPPASLGHKNQNLSKCPDKPNCKFITIELSGQNPLAKIIAIMREIPRSELHKKEQSYLHFTVTSKVFRFIDDVEFYLHSDKKISIKSSSRLGHYDFGANKKRVNTILKYLKR